MRALGFIATLILAAGSLCADEQRAASRERHTPDPSQSPSLQSGALARREGGEGKSATPAPALLLREVRYDGKLTDSQARFTVDIDAESLSKADSSISLFDGDVAILPAKLPSGLRLLREGRQYRLVSGRPGRYKFKPELIAKIARTEPWNEVSFVGPDAGITLVTAQAGGPGVEVQLLNGTALEPEKD